MSQLLNHKAATIPELHFRKTTVHSNVLLPLSGVWLAEQRVWGRDGSFASWNTGTQGRLFYSTACSPGTSQLHFRNNSGSGRVGPSHFLLSTSQLFHFLLCFGKEIIALCHHGDYLAKRKLYWGQWKLDLLIPHSDYFNAIGTSLPFPASCITFGLSSCRGMHKLDNIQMLNS